MKRSLLSISLVIYAMSFPTMAQITITTSDLPTIGTQVIRAVDDVTPISPGNQGTNQVWDFSNLVTTGFDTTLYLPTTGLPYIQDYPDADIAIKHLSGYPATDYDYEYLKYGNDGLRYVGDEDLITFFGDYTMAIHFKCNPYTLSLPLPFTYGGHLVQNFENIWLLASRNAGVLVDSIMQRSNLNITMMGDASGTMITPFGSYQALRVREDIVSHDSVFNWTSSGWIFDHYEESSYSHYRWYTNDYYEVGYYEIDEKKGNSMTYFKSETIVGTKTILPKPDFTIYPNPAQNQLTIECRDQLLKSEIVDLNGKSLLISGPNLTIDISALNPGMYILKTYTSKGAAGKTFIKQ